MSFYVSLCRQSYYYDTVATAGSDQLVGKSFITPAGRRKPQPEHLVASAEPLFVCVCACKEVSAHPYVCITRSQHLRSHTLWLRTWMLIREWRKWQHFLCFSSNYVLSVCSKSPLSVAEEVKVCHWVSDRRAQQHLSFSPPPLPLRLSLPHTPLSWQIESNHQGAELLNSLQRRTAVTLDLSGPAANHTCIQSPVLMVRKCFVRSYHSYVSRVIFVMSEVYDRHVRLHYTLPPPLLLSLPLFVSLSFLFPLVSAVDKLLALASVAALAYLKVGTLLIKC